MRKIWTGFDFQTASSWAMLALRIHGGSKASATTFAAHLVARQVKQGGNLVMNGDQALQTAW